MQPAAGVWKHAKTIKFLPIGIFAHPKRLLALPEFLRLGFYFVMLVLIICHCPGNSFFSSLNVARDRPPLLDGGGKIWRGT